MGQNLTIGTNRKVPAVAKEMGNGNKRNSNKKQAYKRGKVKELGVKMKYRKFKKHK